MPAWEPGDVIALREIWRGAVFEARPVIVVADAPDQAILYLPIGARVAVALDEHEHQLRLPDRPWHMGSHEIRTRSALSFAWPDTPYAVLLLRGANGDVEGWYVNIQEPLRRTALGFDTVDHALDVLIPADRSAWTWKDEDELAEAIDAGLFTEHEAIAFRAAGERGAVRVVQGEPPFDHDWLTWRPDPSWGTPQLPVGWDTLPG
jgi:hypothetical protein